MPEAFATIKGALGGTLGESQQGFLALARKITGDNLPALSKDQKERLAAVSKRGAC